MKLLIGGSPCTHWSIARKGRETQPSGIGWELFKNYLIARDKYAPEYFLYENNKSMAEPIREQITAELGVEPIMINSALVSAQSRKRLYWTNIPGVKQPEDRGIILRDILESGVPMQEKTYILKAQYFKSGIANFVTNGGFGASAVAEPVQIGKIGRGRQGERIYSTEGKSCAVTAQGGGPGGSTGLYAEPMRIGTIESGTQTNHDSKPFRVYSPDGKAVTLQGEAGGHGAKTGLYAVPIDPAGFAGGGAVYPITFDAEGQMTAEIGGRARVIYEVRDGRITIKGQQYPVKLADGFYIIRKLTVLECKRLQTVPDSYIFPVSDTQAYRQLGNGWTVDVIAHILSFCPGIKEKPLEVLSMYDGMSCGRLALDKLGASVAAYWATEIDKYAIQTTQANFPDTVQMGDAFQVREDGWKPWEGVKQ